MNCSDGENETGIDSMDETEDDKAFSKITKLNTEFNSDNANLLSQQQQMKEVKQTNDGHLETLFFTKCKRHFFWKIKMYCVIRML